MAKLVQKWIAEDGQMFDSEAEADRHDQLQLIIGTLTGFERDSGCMDKWQAAEWILDNFERKQRPKPQKDEHYINDCGVMFKIESDMVWQITSGKWELSAITVGRARELIGSGHWSKAV